MSRITTQRLDANGNKLWGANGKSVVNVASVQTDPRIISDGIGGAIITWVDHRNNQVDIYAQRFDISDDPSSDLGSAIVISDEDPVTIELSPSIVTDGDGGAFIAWSENDGVGAININIRRINPSSAASFAITQVATGDYPPYFVGLVSDGNNGVILTYNASTDPFVGGNDFISSSYINKNGTVLSDPVYTNYINGDYVTSVFQQICSDGDGGVYYTYVLRDGTQTSLPESFHLVHISKAMGGVSGTMISDIVVDPSMDDPSVVINSNNYYTTLISDEAGRCYSYME